MIKLRLIILTIVLLSFSKLLFSTDTIPYKKVNVMYALIQDGDTIYVSSIDEVVILPMPKFKRRRDLRKYRRLVYNIKKVYPYSKMAKEKYDEVAAVLDTIPTEKARKEYMKVVEEELKEEFEDELKKLTITQGRILLKMIDREIGHTSYELLKEFRGSFSAFFWQTLARLFGNNLKSEFDAEGEDKLMNEIILLIENGQL